MANQISQRAGLLGALILFAIVLSNGASRRGVPSFLSGPLASLQAMVALPTDPNAAPHEAICGNAALNIGEECDDGNRMGGDGCSLQCTLEYPSSSVALPASIFTMQNAGNSTASGLPAMAMMMASFVGVAYIRSRRLA